MAKLPKVKMNTSLKREFSCALGNFSIEGMEPAKVTKILFDDYKIIATPIDYGGVKGIRITPHVYTSLNDLDHFVNSVSKIVKT